MQTFLNIFAINISIGNNRRKLFAYCWIFHNRFLLVFSPRQVIIRDLIACIYSSFSRNSTSEKHSVIAVTVKVSNLLPSITLCDVCGFEEHEIPGHFVRRGKKESIDSIFSIKKKCAEIYTFKYTSPRVIRLKIIFISLFEVKKRKKILASCAIKFSFSSRPVPSPLFLVNMNIIAASIGYRDAERTEY